MNKKLVGIVLIAIISWAWVWLYNNLPDQQGFVVFGSIIVANIARR